MLPQAGGERDTARLFGTYNTIATLAGSLGALLALVASSPRGLLVYPLAAVVGLAVTSRLSRAIEPLRGGGARLAAAPSLPRRRPPPVGLVRARQLRRWVRSPDLHRLPVRAEDDAAPGCASGRLLCDRNPPGGVLPALGLACGSNRPVADDGVHLPSNLLLIAVAFAPNLPVAIGLLLARSLLSQADVPARQAYVVALVDPSERTAAARTRTPRATSPGRSLRCSPAPPCVPALACRSCSRACSSASTTSASTPRSGTFRSRLVRFRPVPETLGGRAGRRS